MEQIGKKPLGAHAEELSQWSAVSFMSYYRYRIIKTKIFRATKRQLFKVKYITKLLLEKKLTSVSEKERERQRDRERERERERETETERERERERERETETERERERGRGKLL